MGRAEIDTLWANDDLFLQRSQTYLAALAASKRYLAAQAGAGMSPQGNNNRLGSGNRPANNVDEFQRLYQHLAEVSGESFSGAVRTPWVSAWIRQLYGLSGRSRQSNQTPASGSVDPSAALADCLQRFKLLVAGASLRDGRAVRFAPLEMSGTFSLPGWNVALELEPGWKLQGVSSSGLLLIASCGTQHEIAIDVPSGRRIGGLLDCGAAGRVGRLWQAPLAQCDGDLLPLDPWALHRPDSSLTQPCLDSGLDYQVQQHALTEQTLQAVTQYAPQFMPGFRDAIHSIAWKPQNRGDFTNSSDAQLPGGFVVSRINDPLVMADYFIHEYFHQRLFAWEAVHGTFFADDQRGLSCEYYSPWRDDARPLKGLLHAAYVHIPVTRFWLEVLKQGRVTDAQRLYATDRVVRHLLQLPLVCQELARHADWSASGEALFDLLSLDVERLRQQASHEGIPDDTSSVQCLADGTFRAEQSEGRRLSVRSSVLAHLDNTSLHTRPQMSKGRSALKSPSLREGRTRSDRGGMFGAPITPAMRLRV